MVFSCGARSIIMGSKATEQIKAIKNIIGEDVPMAGFVCYGEIAPIITNNKDINLESYFHNDTVVVMALK